MKAGDRFSVVAPDGHDHGQVRALLAALGDRGKVIGRFGGRRDLVRNAHGKPLPCCWAECWTPGSLKHKAVAPHDGPGREGDTLTYLFCGPVHKALWLGQSPPGATALGLITP